MTTKQATCPYCGAALIEEHQGPEVDQFKRTFACGCVRFCNGDLPYTHDVAPCSNYEAEKEMAEESEAWMADLEIHYD